MGNARTMISKNQVIFGIVSSRNRYIKETKK